MNDSTTKNAPAGWYPSTVIPGHERYWNGEAWGSQSRKIGTLPSRPAGWYPDANFPSTERYWNGTAWEDATRVAPVVPQTRREARAMRKKSGLWYNLFH